MALKIPSVTVDLDRPRKLVYTHDSMRRLKESTGSMTPNLGGVEGMLNLGPFLWSCLAPEDRDITVEAIDQMLHPLTRDEMIRALSELVRVSTPDAEGNAAAPTAKAAS